MPCAGDPAELYRLGVETATELCAALLQAGAPGLHFYTLNQSTIAARILESIGSARS